MKKGTWDQSDSAAPESFWSRGTRALRLGGTSGTSTDTTTATSSSHVHFNNADPALISPAHSSDDPSSPIPIARIYSHLSSTSSRHSSRQRQRQRSHYLHNNNNNNNNNDYRKSFDDENDSHMPQHVPQQQHHQHDQQQQQQHQQHQHQHQHQQQYQHQHSNKPEEYDNHSGSTSTIGKLRRALEDSTSKNSIAKFHLSRNDSMILDLRQELAQSQVALQEANDKLQRNQVALEACGDMQTELDKTHASLITANMISQQMQGDYELDIERLNSTLAEKQNIIEDLMKKINQNEQNNFKTSPTSVVHFDTNTNTQIATLKNQLQRLKEINEQQEYQIHQLKGEKSELYNQCQLQKDLMEHKVQDMKKQLDESNVSKGNNSSWESDIAFASLQKRLHTAEIQEEEKTEYIAQLENEISQLKLNQCQISTSDAEGMRHKIQDLTQKLQKAELTLKQETLALRNEIRDKESSIKLLRQENESKEDEISDLENILETLRSQLSDIKEELQNQLPLLDELSEKDERIRRLQTQIEDQTSVIHQLRSREKILGNNTSKSLNESTTEEFLSLQRSLNIMSEQLKTSKARSQSTIQHLQSSLEEAELKYEASERELQQIKAQLDNKENTSKDSDTYEALSVLQEENVTLKHSLNVTKNKLIQAENEFETLRQGFESFDVDGVNAGISATQLSNLQKSLDDKNMKLVEMEAGFEEANFKVKAREQLVSELRTEIHSLTEQVLQLQETQQKPSDTFNEPAPQVNFIAASNLKISNLEAQISEARGDCKAKQEAMSVMKKSLKEALSMLKPLQELVANEEKEKKKYEQSFKMAKEKINDLVKALNDQKLKNDLLSEEEKDSEKINQYINQIQELETELKTSEEYRKKIEEEESKLKSELEQRLQYIDEIEQSLNDAKEELSSERQRFQEELEASNAQLRGASTSESSLKSALQEAENKCELAGNLFETLELILSNEEKINEHKSPRRNKNVPNHFVTKKIEIYIDFVNTLDRSRRELKQKLAASQEDLNSARKKLISLEINSKVEIDRLHKTSKEKNSKLKHAERDIVDLKERISELQDTDEELQNLRQQTSQMQRMEQDLKRHREILEEKEDQILSLKEKQEEVLDELETIRTQYDKTNEDLKKAEESLLSKLGAETELENLKSTVKDSKIRASTFQLKLSEVRKQLTAKKESETKLSQDLKTAKTRIQSLESELSNQSGKQRYLEDQLKQASANIEELQHEINKAEEREHGANFKNVQADRRAVEMKMKLSSTVLSDIPNVTNDTTFNIPASFLADDVEGRVLGLEVKMEDMKNVYEATKKKLERYMMENSELKEEIKILEGEIIETVEEIEFLRQTLSKREKELENAKYIATCSLMKLDELSGAVDLESEGGSSFASETEDNQVMDMESIQNRFKALSQKTKGLDNPKDRPSSLGLSKPKSTNNRIQFLENENARMENDIRQKERRLQSLASIPIQQSHNANGKIIPRSLRKPATKRFQMSPPK